MQNILPKLLVWITGHTRHKVDNLQWSDRLVTYNLFRLWEKIFWRRNGSSNQAGDHIRKESSVRAYYQDGEEIIERIFYTWESLIVHYETVVRLYVKNLFRWRFEWVPIPIPVFANMMWRETPLISIAYLVIAFDTANTAFNSGGTGTTQTLSYTVTGSNPALFVGTMGEVGSDAQTSMTYAAVDVPVVTTITQASIRTAKTWFKGNPATGANDIVLTKTLDTYSEIYAISYSGSQSSNTPDSSAGAAKAAATSFSQATDVVAANCWLAGWGCGEGGGTDWTGGTGTTMRRIASNEGTFDSNATVGTGSQSLNVNTPGASQRVNEAILSFAPSAAAATVPLSNLLLMGVG